MLTAWGSGGLLAPLIIAVLRESTGSYTSALRVIAAILPASAGLPIVIRRPRAQRLAESACPRFAVSGSQTST